MLKLMIRELLIGEVYEFDDARWLITADFTDWNHRCINLDTGYVRWLPGDYLVEIRDA